MRSNLVHAHCKYTSEVRRHNIYLAHLLKWGIISIDETLLDEALC